MSEVRRSKAEKRMIRVMERKGGKGFWILRSAEVPLKRYVRPQPPEPTTPEDSA